MQDFESIALGLRMPAPKPATVKNEHAELTIQEQAIAARLPNSDIYNVTLRILEGEALRLETEHMQAYKDKELFERTGLMAVTARLLYERFQMEVNYHAAEYRGELEAATVQQRVDEMSPEDFIRQGFGMEK
jgi:hypothetical protein